MIEVIRVIAIEDSKLDNLEHIKISSIKEESYE